MGDLSVIGLRQRIGASRKALWAWQVSVEANDRDRHGMAEAVADAELAALGTLCETAPADEFDQLLTLLRDWEALRRHAAERYQAGTPGKGSSAT